MTGEEQFITAIIEQAIEDCAYTGKSVKKIRFKMDAIDWIVGRFYSRFFSRFSAVPGPKIAENWVFGLQ